MPISGKKILTLDDAATQLSKTHKKSPITLDDAVDNLSKKKDEAASQEHVSLEPSEQQKKQFPFLQNPLEQKSDNGTYFTPQSKSQSESTSVEKINPFEKILDISIKHDFATKGIPLTEQNFNSIKQFALSTKNGTIQNGEANPNVDQTSSASRILNGDPTEITNVIKNVQGSIQKQKEQYPLIGGTSARWLPQDKVEQNNQIHFDLDNQNKELVDIGKQALSKSYADIWQQQQDKSDNAANELGDKYRKQLSEIGADSDYKNEATIAQFIKNNKQQNNTNRKYLVGNADNAPYQKPYNALEDKVGDAALKTGSELYKFNNINALYNANIESQQQNINQLSQDESVKEYLSASPQERMNMPYNKNVANFYSSLDDYNNTISKIKELPNSFPQVKAQMDREKVANTWADIVQMRENLPNPLVEGELLKNTFVGKKPTDEDIDLIAKLSGLSTTEVKQYADDANIPSFIGSALRHSANFLIGQNESLNRLTQSDNSATVNNYIAEQYKYKMPESVNFSLNNVNPHSIVRSIFNGIGETLPLILETEAGGELFGGLTGLSTLGRLSTEELSALNSAEKILPSTRIGTVVKNLGLADTEEAGLNSIINATNRAKNFGGGFGTMYLSSYEDAYKEASQYTNDEEKRHQFANQVATASGLSMLVFNSAEFLQNLNKEVDPNKLVSDFLSEKVKYGSSNPIMERFGQAAKTLGTINAANFVPMIQREISKNNLFDYHTSASEFFNEALNSVVNTSVSMLPFGFLGATKKPISDQVKSALYEAGKTPDETIKRIEDNYTNGIISENEKNNQIQKVNTLSQIVNQVTTDKNGNPLPQNLKNEVVYRLMQNSYLTKKAESATDAYKKAYENEIAENSNYVTNILGGETLSPDKLLKQQADKNKLIEKGHNSVDKLLSETDENDKFVYNYSDRELGRKDPMAFLEKVANKVYKSKDETELIPRYGADVINTAKELFPNNKIKKDAGTLSENQTGISEKGQVRGTSQETGGNDLQQNKVGEAISTETKQQAGQITDDDIISAIKRHDKVPDTISTLLDSHPSDVLSDLKDQVRQGLKGGVRNVTDAINGVYGKEAVDLVKKQLENERANTTTPTTEQKGAEVRDTENEQAGVNTTDNGLQDGNSGSGKDVGGEKVVSNVDLAERNIDLADKDIKHLDKLSNNELKDIANQLLNDENKYKQKNDDPLSIYTRATDILEERGDKFWADKTPTNEIPISTEEKGNTIKDIDRDLVKKNLPKGWGIEKTEKFRYNGESRFHKTDAQTGEFISEGNGFHNDNYNHRKTHNGEVETSYTITSPSGKRMPFYESYEEAIRDIEGFTGKKILPSNENNITAKEESPTIKEANTVEQPTSEGEKTSQPIETEPIPISNEGEPSVGKIQEYSGIFNELDKANNKKSDVGKNTATEKVLNKYGELGERAKFINDNFDEILKQLNLKKECQ